jgi:hypothetical protein
MPLEHIASVNCWCRPVRDEEEPAVWVHSDSVRHTDTDTMHSPPSATRRRPHRCETWCSQQWNVLNSPRPLR